MEAEVSLATINQAQISCNSRGQVIVLFFMQICSTIAFAVFYSGLSIFLSQHHHLTKELASLVTGIFLALHYFLPLIGGIIAGRLITYKRLYLFGSLWGIVGCVLVGFTSYFYLGFSLYLINSLVSNVCLNMFATQLFKAEQIKERRIAFFWKYVGMNLGFMLGTLLVGFSSLANNYHVLFMIMCLSLVIGWALLYFFIHEPQVTSLLKARISVTKQIITAAAIFLLMICLMNILFLFAEQTASFITAFAVAILLLIILRELWTTPSRERRNLHIYIGFSLAAISFWTVYLSTPVIMMQIIQYHVARNMFNYTIAPEWFLNIDSIIIVTIVPTLTVYFSKSSHSHLLEKKNAVYFALGLLFTVCALWVLASSLSSLLNNGIISPLYILLYLALLTFAEILTAPIGFAVVGELIPEKKRALMTGVWNMNLAIASLLSGTISKYFIAPHLSQTVLAVNDIECVQQLIVIAGFILLVTAIMLLMASRKKAGKKVIVACEARGA